MRLQLVKNSLYQEDLTVEHLALDIGATRSQRGGPTRQWEELLSKVRSHAVLYSGCLFVISFDNEKCSGRR